MKTAGLGSVGRSTDRRRQTRDLVLDAALRLFSEHGYLGVRVADIAKEAGVSRATFYQHFAEREQILADARWRAGIRKMEQFIAADDERRNTG